MELATAPLISVVIPCYKQAAFLHEAIESVRAQTYPCHETIVVDDGSPDDAGVVAARYPEVRYIRQTNQGVSVARNNGVSESRGEFVFFLDADDRLLPHALEVSLALFRENPSLALVSGRHQVIAIDGAPLPLTHRPIIERDHHVELLRYNYILTGTLMVRRSVFDQVGGFDASLRGCEDYDFTLRLTRDHAIRCHTEEIMQYRQHRASASHNSSVQLRSALTVLRAQRMFAHGDDRRRQALRKGIRSFQEFYGDQVADEVRRLIRLPGERRRALDAALILARHHPRGFVTHFFRKLRNTIRPRDGGVG